ncbi:multidrug ABC transporter ATPase [uncultured Rothia sp.]|uniref:multidrug ABC transporter ATPase n=1 Tax=uncultured Rothia sp. TaxID=316088 RepID=UPI003217A86F
MLVVQEIWAKGRHSPLYDPTSFEIAPGEVIIIQADSQLERTALSLTLTGRMKPSGGEIYLRDEDGENETSLSLKELRARSEIIDSPKINEPENFMRVHDYISEMVSYTLGPFQRPHSKKWLRQRGLEELENLWVEELTGEQNIELMSALAASYPHAEILVFDTPSRHLNHTSMWVGHLQALAQDPEQPRAVIAVVPHISSAWKGKSVVVVNAHKDFETEGN